MILIDDNVDLIFDLGGITCMMQALVDHKSVLTSILGFDVLYFVAFSFLFLDNVAHCDGFFLFFFLICLFAF